ncbi:uncharacterized protein C7orf57 homolog [Chanos chanos]|uniref:Uncharacterized protein C7orf57 homolog n=1 Tax=Chanos chanos TaxID=29144 RepID=A0A6J2W303_CHACN|nr:uncharacterized protein C7orf57 homolog [Chanos chanos]
MTTEPNYRRKKPGHTSNPANASSNGVMGPSSQIPGLSVTAETGPVERTKGRRVGIFETDSDYVKLAKQGGQKGLLWHEETNVETKPGKSYKAPDWFSSAAEGEQHSRSKAASPDATISHGLDKSPTKQGVQPLAAPFGTDDSSSWEKEADGVAAGKQKKPKGGDQVVQAMEKLALSPEEIEKANKYKRMSHEKISSGPVSMSKLLSFGYIEEDKKSPDDDASSMTSEMTSTIAPEDDLE